MFNDDEAIPAFLVISEDERRAARDAARQSPPPAPMQPAPTVDATRAAMEEALVARKKVKADKRIGRMRASLHAKSIPDAFRRWDSLKNKFVDTREEDRERRKKFAAAAGIQLESDTMDKLHIIPYGVPGEGEERPKLARGVTTIAANAPDFEVESKVTSAALRAGSKTDMVEVVDAEGVVLETWAKVEGQNKLESRSSGRTIAIMRENKERETVAKKAAKKKANGARKAPPPNRGVGVIATIIETMKRDRGASVDEMVAVLSKKFPDRAADSMIKTARIQAAKNAKKKDKDDKRGLVYYG